MFNQYLPGCPCVGRMLTGGDDRRRRSRHLTGRSATTQELHRCYSEVGPCSTGHTVVLRLQLLADTELGSHAAVAANKSVSHAAVAAVVASCRRVNYRVSLKVGVFGEAVSWISDLSVALRRTHPATVLQFYLSQRELTATSNDSTVQPSHTTHRHPPDTDRT